MSTLIHERVEAARNDTNPYVICRVPSGWVVMGDVQPVPGYTLLLPDPVVPSLNDLDEAGRTRYLLDMVRLGDALLTVTDAYRVNYDILGNSEPALHAHVFPRYAHEPDEYRVGPVFAYDWSAAAPFGADHEPIRQGVREILAAS